MSEIMALASAPRSRQLPSLGLLVAAALTGCEAAALQPYSDEIVLNIEGDAMWQRGMSPQKLAWEEAKAYCADLQLGGFTDWSLPALDQLAPTGRDWYRDDALCHCAALSQCNIDIEMFPHVPETSYALWSSTPNKVNGPPPDYAPIAVAHIVLVTSGSSCSWSEGSAIPSPLTPPPTDTNYVRCVRKHVDSKFGRY